MKEETSTPAFQPDKLYRANPDFLLREIAGEAILVPIGESAAQLNGMLSVNETFRFLWEQFQEPHTAHEAALAAVEKFSGSPDEIENDVNDYVRESIQHGILIEEDK